MAAPSVDALDGQQTLDRAYEALERELPAGACRVLRKVRSPEARWFRWPLAVLLIIASMFWFLPVIGIELLPIGLLLIAQDVPFMKRPVGLGILWLLERWLRLKAWWRRRKLARVQKAMLRGLEDKK